MVNNIKLWFLRNSIKRVLTSLELTITESNNTFNVSPLCSYDVRQIGKYLIQRGWAHVAHEDEHTYHKGRYEIIVNFELNYVCGLRVDLTSK